MTRWNDRSTSSRCSDMLGRTYVATLDGLLPNLPWMEALPPSIWRDPAIVESLAEERRRALHARLIEVLGDEAANATMRFVPLVPWRVLRRAGVTHLLN